MVPVWVSYCAGVSAGRVRTCVCGRGRVWVRGDACTPQANKTLVQWVGVVVEEPTVLRSMGVLPA